MPFLKWFFADSAGIRRGSNEVLGHIPGLFPVEKKIKFNKKFKSRGLRPCLKT
jgi:hypothetical protein